MHQYVALLRGINVGGNNIIKMADLKACFEKMGFSHVSTYIQSGNVIFDSNETDLQKLTDQIEKKLSAQFSYKSTVVVVSHQELKEAVNKSPKGFGTEPTNYRYDVIFLKAPLSGREAIKEIKVREGVDEVAAGKNVLYFARTIENITKSYLPKIILLPIYKQITIRNWNTTSKLVSLIENT